MEEQILTELNEKLNLSFLSFEHKLNKVRAEGANPNLLDSVTINYYGNFTPLTQLSNIIRKDANLLIVKPFDKNILKDIILAINKSDLALSPIIDEQQIKIFIPPLTEDTRKHFVKLAKEISEEGKINVRNIRHEIVKKIQTEIKDEDNKKWLTEEVQKLVNQYNKKIEDKYKEKSKKLMVI